MRFAIAVSLFLAALALPPRAAGESACPSARSACLAAANHVAAACRSQCQRGDDPACAAECKTERDTARAACRAVRVPCAAVCGPAVAANACAAGIRICRAAARAAHDGCRQACGDDEPGGRDGCRARCRQARARAEIGCGYVGVARAAGAATLPDLPHGTPADLSLLEPAERAVIDAADARATALRTRRVRLWIGQPGATVRVVQTKHGFPFGFPIDLRRFANAGDRDWYAQTMAAHFNLVVIENTLKWAGIEPAEGVRTYGNADADVAWATGLGLPVKGHTLLWGIVPPFSSSAVPAWAISRFAAASLPPADAAALREIVRRHVLETVARYRGRLSIWDATNETLQILGQWFTQRLGPGIVDDVFRWTHEADPEVQLVFNEWIVEVFPGFANPTAADVRDRVVALRAAGVPIHAIGQQAHFVPAAAFSGIPVDLSQRTHLDDYASALDTLAEAGLPIHITETNFITPEDPEGRAAQAEGLLRIWWGHPAVEQIVFWGPWNKVAGRDEFNVGFWDNDRNLSRHGAAVLSLLNDRWRTDVEAVTDASGAVELTATHGEHVAEWTVDGAPVHASFRVEPGPGTATFAVTAP